MGFSVYLHIPFCEVKCGYCDFFSVPRGFEDFDLQEEYAGALIREIHERSGEFCGRPVRSIFFGGGTPSLLAPVLLEEILDALARHFSWSRQTEITLEANPKTVSLEKLRAFREMGFNRISIGVQSFQDRFLKTLGRIHDGNDARRTVHDARAAGFENVSCDLIFALPGQTFADWENDLETAVGLGTDHLSAYHLTIEANTPFETLHRQNRLLLPPEDDGLRMLTWTRESLAAAGLPAYEISNFARPGFECVHNRNYWRYGDYLGFGAGAAGFVRSKEDSVYGVRRHNVRNLKKYLEREMLDFEDRIDRRTAMGEFCMLGLRTREGIDGQAFASSFGVRVEDVFSGVIARWKERGHLQGAGSGWSLTPDGLLFTDEVAASFLP
ncbi:MAG TPA: radical SAM family heme chaperone HemW [bacterium]|nr:radical SAM family heme chaperone HemW [bacterium]